MQRKMLIPLLLPVLIVSLNVAAQTTQHNTALQLVVPMDSWLYMLVAAPVVLAFLGLFLCTGAKRQH